MTAPAIEFPAIGVSDRGRGVPYAFVAATPLEMRECPLHSVIRGHLKNHYFVDSAGNKFIVVRPVIAGLDMTRIREVGVVTSIVSAVLSAFNVPVLISFDLRADGVVPLDELRTTLAHCVESRPRCYTLNKSERVVRQRLNEAASYEDLAIAISS